MDGHTRRMVEQITASLKAYLADEMNEDTLIRCVEPVVTAVEDRETLKQLEKLVTAIEDGRHVNGPVYLKKYISQFLSTLNCSLTSDLNER